MSGSRPLNATAPSGSSSNRVPPGCIASNAVCSETGAATVGTRARPLCSQADATTLRQWRRRFCARVSSSFTSLREICSMNCGVRVELESSKREAVQPDLRRLEQLFAEGLKRFGGPWLAGPSFGAVDAMYAPIAFRMQTYGLVLADNGSAWYFQGEQHRKWPSRLIEELKTIPASAFDAVDTSSLMVDKDSARVR